MVEHDICEVGVGVSPSTSFYVLPLLCNIMHFINFNKTT
jgi:hypothetical protein